MAYQPRKTRLMDHEEQRMIRRILIAGGATVLLLGLIFFGGVRALISLGTLFDRMKGNQVTTNDTNNFLIAPRLEPLDNATNSAKLQVIVDSQKDMTIELFANDQSLGEEKVTDSNNAVYSGVFLKEGSNTLYAVAKDTSGKTSQPSTKLQVIYDATPPKLEVTTPTDRQTITDSRDVKVSGKTEVSAALTVNDSPITVNPDGMFTTTIHADKGEGKATVIATDSAGNQTKIERTFVIN